MNEENKIPTNKGKLTVPEIVNNLLYSSYEANRGYGMTHEQLVSIGIGNEDFKAFYESEHN